MSSGSPYGDTKQRLLRVVSRCETVDDFVGVFRRFSDGESIFIVTKSPKPLGTVQPVAITLKGGRAVLSGTGEVVEVHDASTGVAGRPGMRIKFTSLDDEGRAVLKRMAEPEAQPTLPAPRPASSRTAPAPVATASATSSPLPGMPNVGTPPDPDDETTSVSGESAMMHRATGSSVIIPANPFSELPDESLMGFIECTLYEDSGLIRVPDDDATAAGSDRFESVESQPSGLPAWWPKDDQGRVTPPRATPRPPSADGTPPQTIAPPRAASPVPTQPHAPAPPMAASPPVAAASPVAPAVAPVGAVNADVLQPQYQPSYETGPVVRSAQWKLPVVAALGAALGALLMGYFIWGGDKQEGDARAAAAADVSTPRAKASTAESAAPTPTPAVAAERAQDAPAEVPTEAEAEAPTEAEAEAPTEAESEAPTEAEPEPEPEPEPAVADGAAADPAGAGCTLKVVTSSKGATVSAAGKKLGDTPLEREMGCGTVALTVEHPRYKTVTQTVTLVAGETTPVELRLERPTHRLTIKSSPSGAAVTVGGRSVGKTPVTTTVVGYEKVRVKLSLSGYKPWSEQVYARRAKQTVSAKLKSLAKRVPTKRARKKRK